MLEFPGSSSGGSGYESRSVSGEYDPRPLWVGAHEFEYSSDGCESAWFSASDCGECLDNNVSYN